MVRRRFPHEPIRPQLGRPGFLDETPERSMPTLQIPRNPHRSGPVTDLLHSPASPAERRFAVLSQIWERPPTSAARIFPLELAVERGKPDSEHVGGPPPVTTDHLDRLQDGEPFEG